MSNSVDQLSNDDANSVDGEGVWAPEIESAFHEGLKLFPPCGRRKHILQEEGGGKMYGRNELIARHILMRTGKIRTRKQVSSHIQVLNRRKQKIDTQSTSASTSSETPSPSSAFSITETTFNTSALNNNHLHHNINNNHHLHHNHNSFNNLQTNPILPANNYNNHVNQMQTSTISSNGLISTHQSHNNTNHLNNHHQNNIQLNEFYDFWNDVPIVTQRIRLVEFSAFIEYSTANRQNNSSLISPLLGAVTIHDRHQQSDNNHLNLNFNHDTNIHSNGINDIYNSNGNHRLSSSQNANTNGIGLFSQNNGTIIHQQASQGRDNLNRFNFNEHQLLNSTQGGSSSGGTGIKRHNYVKIDHLQSFGRQSNNKLETIDINQIQDKFPKICELFQRSSPYSFFLVKFWADINSDYEYNIEDQNTNICLSSHFETIERFDEITISSKACSYGCEVVEKVDKVYGTYDSVNQRYSYRIANSPMCELMIKFIKKLRQLPETSQMNSVLENFTVLQVITTDSKPEILMCLAYVFEVASREQSGPQYHVYRLSKD